MSRVGMYREDYGPREHGGGVGEDIDMFLRSLAADAVIVYNPDALVHHIIPASRSTKELQRHKARSGCEEYVRWLQETAPGVPKIGGLPRYLYRLAIDDALAYGRSLLR